MKTMHIVTVIFILVVLIAICMTEEFMVSTSLNKVQDSCYQIEQILKEKEDLRNMDMVLAVDNLEDGWTGDEGKLCFIVNHKNIQEIGQEISKIKMYIPANDIDALRVSLSTIKMYCKSYMHFMGASFHNVL